MTVYRHCMENQCFPLLSIQYLLVLKMYRKLKLGPIFGMLFGLQNAAKTLKDSRNNFYHFACFDNILITSPTASESKGGLLKVFSLLDDYRPIVNADKRCFRQDIVHIFTPILPPRNLSCYRKYAETRYSNSG